MEIIRDADRGFAVAVILKTPRGIPMVLEKKPGRQALYKYPGGKRDNSESPEETAKREYEEETGASLDGVDMRLLREEDRGTHDFYLFGAELPALPKLKPVGDEGELVEVFTTYDLQMRREEIFSPHWEMPEARAFIFGPRPKTGRAKVPA